jgi:hypothetical protein
VKVSKNFKLKKYEFKDLKLLSKSKLHILTKLLHKSRSFNCNNFIKLVEINRYEIIRSSFLYKEKLYANSNLFNYVIKVFMII